MKFKKLAPCLGAVLAISTLFGGCKTVSETIQMPALVPMQTQIDSSIPLLSGDQSDVLSQNIDRGFRMEVYYTLGSGKGWPEGESDGYQDLEAVFARYEEENPREIQVYIYLTEYYDKALDQKAFDQLEAYLSYLRERHMGVLLRFAYDPAQPYDFSPAEAQLLEHIGQLKEWITGHRALFDDIVTAYQMGIIGAWGEWGGSKQKYDRKKIALAICDMVPEGTYVQGRYTDVTKLTKKAPNADYVGFHNDFLVARPHPWNTAGDNNNASAYRAFAQAAPLRMNDGEMPWVGATQEPEEYVDGKEFIKQCFEHHLATQSIEHNYKEAVDRPVTPEQYNIARWKTEPITPADLTAMGCPYYESWFMDGQGQPVIRTVYEYLRDYLGYQLILSNLSVQQEVGNTAVSFMITNVGLGAPLTLDRMELVVKDKATGEEQRIPLTDFDPAKLTTYGQQTFRLTVPGNADAASYGVAILRNKSVGGDYAIRCANNVPFENGVHIIKA